MILSLDFETYSDVDITEVGAYHYAMHPSTEALMLGWAIDDGPVQILDFKGDVLDVAPACAELRERLEDRHTYVSAFNAQFERLILKHVLGMDVPIERFICTQVRGFGLSFTGSLDDMLAQTGIQSRKDPRGKALINRFSRPQGKSRNVARWTAENDPEGYAEFMSYCQQDVEVERQLRKYFDNYEQLPSEQRLYCLDQKINDVGVPVDRKLIKTALTINTIEREHILEQMRELTGLENPNSNQQLQSWLAENGLKLPDMTKDTIKEALKEGVVCDVNRTALRLKQQISKSSVSKWTAFNKCQVNGRVHGMFQFGGASRTNRWAGRLVQLQNLPQGGNTTKDPSTLAEIILAGGHSAVKALYGKPLMALSDAVRAAITAPDGFCLNVSDLKSIESRVVGWIADCALMNKTFANGMDTYKVFASELYKTPYDEVTKQQRNFSKPPVLGCSYMLGAKGLIGYAEGMGVNMDDTQAQISVDTFRNMYPEIPELWEWCKQATFRTTRTGETVEGKHGLKTFAHGEFLFLQLPSGRCIAYHKPAIELREAPWGDMIENFTFMGKDRFTMKWQRISAHPGFITENIIQGVARDILAVWMTRADEAGFTLCGHVHDELISLETCDRVDELNELIKQPIPWATGLLLDAEGYVAQRYRKD